MSSQKHIQNDDNFPDTHYFIYKGKKFPIKFDFFKISSKKFAKDQIRIDSNQNIHLIDDKSEIISDLSEDSIQNFINYVQHQDTVLTSDNVSGINYLAKRYEVISLIKATEDYINEHHKDIILPALIFNQNDPSFDTSYYENVIIDNFEEYIEEDLLQKLKIPILYRIFDKFYSKFGKNQKISNKKIVDFCFKCLDVHKREASVLFSFIDIEDASSNHLNRLITEYSNIFDFHFINSSIVKTFYEIQSEMILKEKQNQMKYDEFMKNVKEEIDKLKEINEKLVSDKKINDEKYESDLKIMKDEINKLKKENEKQMSEQKQKEEQNSTEINMLRDEISKIKSDFDKQLNEQKQKVNSNSIDMKKLKDELDSLKKENEKQLNKQEQKEEQNSNDIRELRNEISKIKSDYDKQLNEFKKQLNSITFIPFTSDRFNGIISHLGHGNPKNVISDGTIEITASPNQSDDLGLSKHVVEYDSDSYYYSTNVKDSWIMFDFKQRKVKLSHYSIKTNRFGDAGHWHLQNWCIEGSNDKSSWKELDARNNEKSLDHKLASNTFEIRNSENNNFYKFIKLRQTDVNTQGNHEILLSSIEFFGNIIDK